MAKRWHKLPSAAWVNGGNIQIPLKDLPPLARVRAFFLRFESKFTCGAAAAPIPSTQLHRLISMIDAGPNARGSGQYFHTLRTIMRRGDVDLAAGIPATNAGVFYRNIDWKIPYDDKRAAFKADGQPQAIMFDQNVLSIETAAFAGLDTGDNTWNTLSKVEGTLRAWAILDEPNDKIGSVVKFGTADLTGQSPTLEPGLYTDVFLFRETGAVITSAEVATIAAQVDGAALFDDLKLGEYAHAYNDANATGSDLQTSDDDAPPIGLEKLNDQPAAIGNGSAVTISVPFLPIIFPDPGYKLTHMVRVEQALRLDFTGTDSTFHVGYRKIVARSEAMAVADFQKIGRRDITNGKLIAPNPGSKKALTGRNAIWGRYMPFRALASR